MTTRVTQSLSKKSKYSGTGKLTSAVARTNTARNSYTEFKFKCNDRLGAGLTKYERQYNRAGTRP